MKTVSRTSKHNNYVNTILYEIGMLKYCFRRIGEGPKAGEQDYNLSIEGFLLHYRNLIEFFGSHGDLKAKEPTAWSPRTLSSDEVRSIQDKRPFKKYRGAISQYLSHCHRIRAEKDRGWNAAEMYARIEPVMKNFPKLFPPLTVTRGAVFAVRATDASTTSMEKYSPSVLLPDAIPATPKKPE